MDDSTHGPTPHPAPRPAQGPAHHPAPGPASDSAHGPGKARAGGRGNQLARRAFLASATAVAAAAVVGPRTAGPEEHPPLEPLAGEAAPDPRLAPVRHVVILMQENRSFDHYFGALKGVRGFGDHAVVDVPGTTSGLSGRTVFQQPRGSGWLYPWRLSAGSGGWKSAQCKVDGGGHSWTDQHSAWNGGRMDNWYRAKGSTGMTLGHLTRADIPYNYALADAYTICDAYHCSSLTGTGPNRDYLWSGSIGAGLPGANRVSHNGGDFRRKEQNWVTYAEQLRSAGISWKVYQVYDRDADKNYGDNALEYFAPFMTADPAKDGKGDPVLWRQGVAGVPYSGGDVADAIIAALRADVTGGTLPRVSWIVTDYANSEHPNASPGVGATVTKRVLEALAADQAVLDSTVFILTYDENDGFFDHVPPPVPADTADATEYVSGAPIGLGFRVPMIIASPWTRGGRVNSQVFDHTSVLRFLEQWTGVRCPNISAWRRAVCGDLTSAFDFANPVYGPLPALPGAVPAGQPVMTGAACDATAAPTTPAGSGSRPAQEPGNKAACALPYQVNAYLDRYEGSDPKGTQKVWIALENRGPQATGAAHLAAYANAYRGGGPWQYTVGPDGATSDFFNIGGGYGNGRYDLTVVGPNRFLRRFTGDTSGGTGRYARVRSYFADREGATALWFGLANDHPTQTATFTVTSNNYRSGTWTYQVPAGRSTDDYFNQLTHAYGWYDFTITVSNDPAWSQRFIGHIENGRTSRTGSVI
ncbi:phospholipase C, phosphocholine-specific [Streptomyces sp. LP05-1]|uniref:phospholipase C n=1 Tax=Streptomyces pyxinae TaxID=2970734 RepID=A0ABT2CEH8_9ACTN|nr:phospholipase C, phosphocholine-specific [Streptomyces sp. LP05-1]MCS0635766.1 phospholipase C, phosphocholine-specific [Streptomyces sp. LP05-1]